MYKCLHESASHNIADIALYVCMYLYVCGYSHVPCMSACVCAEMRIHTYIHTSIHA